MIYNKGGNQMYNIPLFKGGDRNYVEKLFNFESKE